MYLSESTVCAVENMIDLNLMEELDKGETKYEYDPDAIDFDFGQMSKDLQVSVFKLLHSPREYSVLLNALNDEQQRTLIAIKACLIGDSLH